MKKTRKMLILSFLAIMIITFGTIVVKAAETGDGHDNNGETKPLCATVAGNCFYNNKNKKPYMKVSFIYADGTQGTGSFKKTYGSIYIKGSSGTENSHVTSHLTFETMESLGLVGCDFNDYGTFASSYFTNCLGSGPAAKANFLTIFNRIMGTSLDEVSAQAWIDQQCAGMGYTRDNCHYDLGGNRGFRIIAEPIVSICVSDSSGYCTSTTAADTVRHWLETGVTNSSSTKKWYATMFYMKSPATNGSTSDLGFNFTNDLSPSNDAMTGATSPYGMIMHSWPIIDESKCDPSGPMIAGKNPCCNASSDNLLRPLTSAEQATCSISMPTCDYKFDQSIPSSCTSSSSGHVNDINDWKCIFKSTISTNPIEVRTHYIDTEAGLSSNPYCKIYCREDISYDFPAGPISVHSGRYMTVNQSFTFSDGIIQPIRTHGYKECRSTSSMSDDNVTKDYINWPKFVKDFNKAEKKVYEAWDNYLQAYADNEACSRAREKSEHTCNECIEEGDPNPTTGEPTCLSRCNSKYYDYKGTFTLYGAKHDGSNIVGSCSYVVSNDIHTEDTKSSVTTAKAAAVESAYGTYKSEYDAVTTLIYTLNACTTGFDKITYKFNPNIKFDYEEPKYGATWTLNANKTMDNSSTKYTHTRSSFAYTNAHSTNYWLSESDSNITPSTHSIFKTGSLGGSISTTLKRYVGSGKSKITKSGSEFVYINDYGVKTFEREYEYKLPDNTYRYIEKATGLSSSSITDADAYVDVTVPNLPTHYSTKPGSYNYHVVINDWSSGNKFNEYNFDNYTFNSHNYKMVDNNYECQYKIPCNRHIVVADSDCGDFQAVCPDETNSHDCGLTFVYRKISLYSETEAFPDINGIGRQPGENWQTRTYPYIENNRGVSNYQVYRLSPLYEVDLDPATMRAIRSYNSTNDLSDFNMSCSTNDGIVLGKWKKCKSAFLRNTSNVFKFGNRVKGCAISGSGYTNCGPTYGIYGDINVGW